jgi:UPF0755 protein
VSGLQRLGARRWKRAAGLAVLLAAALLASWLGWPHELPVTPYAFELTPGRTLRGVARDLGDQGLLRWPGLFALVGRLDPRSSQLRAGSYLIEQPVSPFELYRILFRGLAQQHEVTLIEGYTVRQIRASLDREEALQHDLRALSDEELLRQLHPDLAVSPDHALPEGLFFPDTYFFTRGSSDLAVLQRAWQAQRRQLERAWQARAPDLPLADPYQALILASIIERETARAEERPLVAGVFVNRLRIGMRLQTDPTVIYGLGARYDGHLHHPDLLADTPWNTYTRAGLPPTPIGLAGLGALQAALHPAATRALYFVARGDGTHQFSATLAAHERAVDAFQRHATLPGARHD